MIKRSCERWFLIIADGGEVWKPHILADKICEQLPMLSLLTRYGRHNMVYYYGQMQLLGDLASATDVSFFLASLDSHT